MRYILPLLILLGCLVGCQQTKKSPVTTINPPTETTDTVIAQLLTDLHITPIHHASFIIQWKETTIFIDPVNAAAFNQHPDPDIILITDIHGDHMHIETLDSLHLEKTQLIAPQAVAEKLPAAYTDYLVVLNNGEKKEVGPVIVEGIPMYNLREEALQYHPKGRGNGYVLTLGSKKIYISGDTEDIPEMKALTDIDIAFVCMNQPWTMTVDRAIPAVMSFKPKLVYPYHYRGKEKDSDVVRFKNKLQQKNPEINVVLLDWYPNS